MSPRRSPFAILTGLCALCALVLTLTVASASAADGGEKRATASKQMHKKGHARKHHGGMKSFALKTRKGGRLTACSAKRSNRRLAAKCARWRKASRTTRAPTTRAPVTRAPTTPTPAPEGRAPTAPRAPTTPQPRAPTTPTPTPTTPAPAPTTPAPDPAPSAPAPSTGGSARGWNGFGVNNWPGADWRPYAASSPFNQPIGSTPLHANSAGIVQKVLSWGTPGNIIAGSSGTTSDFAHPTYYAQPSDPIYTLRATGTKNAIDGLRIPIPDEAQAAKGDDGHLTVVTPDGWEYDFWRVASKPSGGGTLSYSIGGRTRIDGNGIDSKATASNFGNLAGIIRAQELAAGRINHALFIVVKCTSSGTGFGFGTTAAPSSSQGAWVHPASHGGARCSAADEATAPPMGARFTLDLSDAQINALAVPAWKKTIFRALATYGGYVGDTGGSGFAFQFESGATYTSFGVADPLVAFSKSAGVREGSGSWAGTYAYNMATGLDWSKYLQVVEPPSPTAVAAAAPKKKAKRT